MKTLDQTWGDGFFRLELQDDMANIRATIGNRSWQFGYFLTFSGDVMLSLQIEENAKTVYHRGADSATTDARWTLVGSLTDSGGSSEVFRLDLTLDQWLALDVPVGFSQLVGMS